MATKASAEDAVRNYLTALRDPSSLVDTKEIERLQAQLGQTSDPVELLRLRQRLHDLNNASPERYEEAFVKHAQQWAESNGIGAEAFRAEGVGDDVLRRAGFSVRGGGQRRRARKRTSRTRVSSDQIRAAVPPRAKFTLKDIQQKTQGSIATVRSTINAMVEGGEVNDLGPSDNHKGPGRAPRVYQRA